MLVVMSPDTPTAAPLFSSDCSPIPPVGVTLNGCLSSGPPGELQSAPGLLEAPIEAPVRMLIGLNSAPKINCGPTAVCGSPMSGLPDMYSWYGVRHAARDSLAGACVRSATLAI